MKLTVFFELYVMRHILGNLIFFHVFLFKKEFCFESRG